MSDEVVKKKPKLRGYFHQEAFFISLGASMLLIAKSSTTLSLAASIIYAFGLLFLFGISAIYHRIHWEAKPRAILKRLDHSAIFILIASTATPLCMLALPEKDGHQFLLIIWGAALIGILQSVFWGKAPKFVSAFFYIGMGWLAVPYVNELKASLGGAQVSLIVIGGVVYTVGAIFYATKKPKLSPDFFGYHELFHFFTLIGAALHFIVIYQLIK
jgi:hemolysin III